jgi:peptide-methionine (S)-S-oxide reductase
MNQDLDSLQTAYFASGCFWCVEAVFESVKGVQEAESGYSGGASKNPTYEEICTGRSGHAESVKVYYDSSIVSYETLVDVFFNSHDPSTLNRQGPDSGTQYRSAIFYETDEERKIAKAAIKKLRSNGTRVTTEVTPLDVFWIAEDYHQDYERNHPNQSYVRAVSIPRLNAFKAKMPEVLK